MKEKAAVNGRRAFSITLVVLALSVACDNPKYLAVQAGEARYGITLIKGPSLYSGPDSGEYQYFKVKIDQIRKDRPADSRVFGEKELYGIFTPMEPEFHILELSPTEKLCTVLGYQGASSNRVCSVIMFGPGGYSIAYNGMGSDVFLFDRPAPSGKAVIIRHLDFFGNSFFDRFEAYGVKKGRLVPDRKTMAAFHRDRILKLEPEIPVEAGKIDLKAEYPNYGALDELLVDISICYYRTAQLAELRMFFDRYKRDFLRITGRSQGNIAFPEYLALLKRRDRENEDYLNVVRARIRASE